MLEKCHSSKPYHLGAIPLLLLEETLAGASYCFAGVVVEAFLSLVVVITMCSVGMA